MRKWIAVVFLNVALVSLLCVLPPARWFALALGAALFAVGLHIFQRNHAKPS